MNDVLFLSHDVYNVSPSPLYDDDGTYAVLVALGKKFKIEDGLRTEYVPHCSEVPGVDGGLPDEEAFCHPPTLGHTVLVCSWCCTEMPSRHCSAF